MVNLGWLLQFLSQIMGKGKELAGRRSGKISVSLVIGLRLDFSSIAIYLILIINKHQVNIFPSSLAGSGQTLTPS